MLKILNKQIKLLAIFALLSTLGACASTVNIKAEVPVPLVNKIPLSGELVITDEFKTYTYNEADTRREFETLNLGEAQTQTFERVFARLLSPLNPRDQAADLIITPQVLSLEYALPSENKLKVYEFWLKYRVQVTDAEQQNVADWIIKGYGKAQAATLTTPASAINSAADIALRDVGAQLAIGFPRQDRIKPMIDERTSRVQSDESINSDSGLINSQIGSQTANGE